jgi:ribosomal protein S18 acetylase RimI-like enzyme
MIPESGRSELHVQIHPDHRDLEDDMYAWAEDHLGDRADDGTCRIVTWAFDADRARRRVLERRGYRITDAFGFSRSRTLAAPIPDAPVAAGYTVRGLRPGDEEDGDRWADVVRAVFAHVGPGSAQGERNFRLHSPGYDPGLHLFAEAAGGGFAAFAGLTVDESNRFAQFEPVGTHPDHLRLGLARAVMAEGMRRLRDRGHVDLVYVGTGSAVPANRLYRALGFGDEQVEHAWEKVWRSGLSRGDRTP